MRLRIDVARLLQAVFSRPHHWLGPVDKEQAAGGYEPAKSKLHGQLCNPSIPSPYLACVPRKIPIPNSVVSPGIFTVEGHLAVLSSIQRVELLVYSYIYQAVRV